MATTPEARPELRTGDRLTRAEFHRRYCLRPDIKKAELVGGAVHVPSPVRGKHHGEPEAMLAGWMLGYAARHPNLHAMTNSTVFLSPDDEVQPDLLLFRESSPPPGARYDAQGYVVGAPDLVCEVAASSTDDDLSPKMTAYQRAGVPEYLVWRVLDGALDWFRLRAGGYVPLAADAAGVIESEAFPGLRLDVPALLRGDTLAVLAALGLRPEP
jgi:Uma2 family endonuclease